MLILVSENLRNFQLHTRTAQRSSRIRAWGCCLFVCKGFSQVPHLRIVHSLTLSFYKPLLFLGLGGELILINMEKLLSLARNVNWGYNTRNSLLFETAGVQLFNYALPIQAGSKILVSLEDTTSTQIVGKAFSYIARSFDNGDPKVNSVAAENAYYCLAKSIKAGNTYAAPELFMLLETKPDAILDKFVETLMAEKATGLSRIFYYDANRVQSDAKDLIPYVKYYIASIFYNVDERKLLIPDDILTFPQTVLEKTLVQFAPSDDPDDLSFLDSINALNEGCKYFTKVYKEIEDTLLNF